MSDRRLTSPPHPRRSTGTRRSLPLPTSCTHTLAPAVTLPSLLIFSVPCPAFDTIAGFGHEPEPCLPASERARFQNE